MKLPFPSVIGEVDKIFIPVNICKTHWILVVVDFFLKAVKLYDPIPGSELESQRV